MINTNRRTITKYQFVSFFDFFQPSVQEMILYLENLKVQGWTGMNYDEDEVTLTQRRLETDEEYEKRIAMEEEFEKRRIKDIDGQRKRRYQDYLRLKEEFGE
jgi:hypothetical protein